MRRIAEWEKALVDEIQRHMGLPSVYGVSDCFKMPDDCVFAMTGERINDAAMAGYSSPLGAAKLMRENGFETVADVFAARFEEIPVLLAQRGDIGVVENNGQICGGVFSAIGFVVRDDDGVSFISVRDVKTAYKVAR